MKRLSHQTDIDRPCRCVYSACVFVVCACRCVGDLASTYCTVPDCIQLSESNIIDLGREGIFLFPRRFNENQAKGKVSLLMNRHQAITQLTPGNNSEKKGEGAGDACYTQTHTFMHAMRRVFYKLSLSSVSGNT